MEKIGKDYETSSFQESYHYILFTHEKMEGGALRCFKICAN
jgi:hypothetical protein